MNPATDPTERVTPEMVAAAVAQIDAMKRDDEMAHSREDDLHQGVLRAIAAGMCDDPAECARLALTSLDLNFSRWCA